MAAVIAALLLVTGCADQRPDSAAPPTLAPAAETVTVVRTGGIAGVNDVMVVRPDGAWTRTDRDGNQRTGRLSPDERRELDILIADPRLADEARRASLDTNCSDAFNYSVTIGSRVIHYTDCPADANQAVAAMAVVEFVDANTGH